MKKLAGSIIVLLVLSIQLQAQKSEIFVKDSVAVRGYDVVAYFTQSAPVKGNSEFVYVWKGGKWYFANRENQEAFKASPEKYAPQYGGYCAYGTAGGYKAPTDPDAWTVSDGKLYLNYNKKVMENWRKDQANFIDKANKNWPTVKLQE
ncbi:YHS domain protein [Runella rosea]|uniref:YHS domain protein n=1 Tax=Runella rosea TaxID=2259595 RepID=A0A344TP85_9BACT|nr:YHS domain-containing (seleno)protein [Runella rosea]AXE20456.1 YHS domain protein [Runella rosea]